MLALAGLVAVVAMAVFGLVFRARSGTAVVLAGVGSLALISGLLSLGPVVGEGVRDGGSWFGQQIGALQGRTCGILDRTGIRAPDPRIFDEPVRNPQGGVAMTPDEPDATAWAKGSLFGPIAVDVISGAGESEPVVMAPSADVWALIPPGRSVQWTDPAVVVAQVSGVPAVPATEILAQSRERWFVEPGLALQAPCVQSASIRSGVLGDVRYNVGRPTWVSSGLLAGGTRSWEGGCATPTSPQQAQCVVVFDTTRTAPPAQREITERVS